MEVHWNTYQVQLFIIIKAMIMFCRYHIQRLHIPCIGVLLCPRLETAHRYIALIAWRVITLLFCELLDNRLTRCEISLHISVLRCRRDWVTRYQIRCIFGQFPAWWTLTGGCMIDRRQTRRRHTHADSYESRRSASI